jgi:hypothetical protein
VNIFDPVELLLPHTPGNVGPSHRLPVSRNYALASKTVEGTTVAPVEESSKLTASKTIVIASKRRDIDKGSERRLALITSRDYYSWLDANCRQCATNPER